MIDYRAYALRQANSSQNTAYSRYWEDIATRLLFTPTCEISRSKVREHMERGVKAQRIRDRAIARALALGTTLGLALGFIIGGLL